MLMESGQRASESDENWAKDLKEFRLRWQRGWPSRRGALPEERPAFFDILHVARIRVETNYWQLDDREIILGFLDVKSLCALDTAISCKKERKIMYESAYPGWDGGVLTFSPVTKIGGVFWWVIRGVGQRTDSFLDFEPSPEDPTSVTLEEYVLAMNHEEDMKEIHTRVSGVASKYLRSRDFETVEKLMKAAMKVVIGTRYAGGKHQENGGVEVNFIPPPDTDSKVIQFLIEERQTLLYRCTKDCNVEGVRFCLYAGASATNHSMNEHKVSESPLYFLAGPGSLSFDPTARAEMFEMLLAAAINENVSAGYNKHYSSIWAYGHADVDDSKYYLDRLYETEPIEGVDEEDTIDGVVLKVDDRYRIWTVMHQAAYWGHTDLVEIMLLLDCEVADQYLHYVEEEGDDNSDEERQRVDSKVEINFGGFTALHAALMHSFSRKVESVLPDLEARKSATFKMVSLLFTFHSSDDDEMSENIEEEHKSDCEKCKSATESPYRGGEKSLRDICDFYLDGSLLKNRFQVKALSMKYQSASDLAIVKYGTDIDPDLVCLFDPNFEPSSYWYCSEVGLWIEREDIDYDELRAIESIDDDVN